MLNFQCGFFRGVSWRSNFSAALAALFLGYSGLDASGELIGRYEFLGNFDNSVSGAPSLEPVVGIGADVGFYPEKGWHWAPEDVVPAVAGLSLNMSEYVNTSVLESYSLAITFELSETDSYRKIVDFASLTGDAGIYAHGNNVIFYTGSTVAVVLENLMTPNTQRTFLLTRTAGKEISVYTIGQESPEVVFEDPSDYFAIAKFPIPESSDFSSSLNFFLDDRNGSEFSRAGAVYDIAIWDEVLDSDEVEAYFNTIPEPMTFPLMGGALLAVAAYRRHRKLR